MTSSVSQNNISSVNDMSLHAKELIPVILVAVGSIILYSIYIKIVANNKELMNLAFYRISIYATICDSALLLLTTVTALMDLTLGVRMLYLYSIGCHILIRQFNDFECSVEFFIYSV